jgi:predicted glycoside hydrolase/deacetylase ChbG (UPF0249 family)
VTRQLVINADDFGFTRGVNEGIVEAHRKGILTSASLMANGPAYEQAIELARANPGLDVGCHLVLVGGRSLLAGARPLPKTAARLVEAIALGRVRVYEELRAQVKKIIDHGARPTHLDTHEHTHLLPPVLRAVARLSEEFSIPWVRRPFDFPLEAGGVPVSRRAVSKALGLVRPWFHRVLEGHGCRTTNHFAGFQITGLYRTRELIQLIERLPEGSTEFLCHPGFCTDELLVAPTRLKESRPAELEALVAPETRAALERCEVGLVSYRELGGEDE